MTDLSYLVRGGLGAVGELLRGGQPVTVAYLGGPSPRRNRGRRAGYQLSKQDHGLAARDVPRCHHCEINAGIGGTASDLGAFRLERACCSIGPT